MRIFLVLCIAAFVAAYWNPIHLLTGIVCLILALMSLFDDSDSESLWQTFKAMKQ